MNVPGVALRPTLDSRIDAVNAGTTRLDIILSRRPLVIGTPRRRRRYEVLRACEHECVIWLISRDSLVGLASDASNGNGPSDSEDGRACARIVSELEA